MPSKVRRLPSVHDLDFRASADDAWYAVRLDIYRLRSPEAAILRVMFCEFPEEVDEWFQADEFETFEELEAFKGRFRPSSTQVQDDECRKVTKGSKVCASHANSESELRFYDAEVVSVIYSNHDSLCDCKFVVKWLHANLAHIQEEKSIQDITLLPFAPLENMTLDNFLELAKKIINVKTELVTSTKRKRAEIQVQEPDSAIYQKENSAKKKFEERSLSIEKAKHTSGKSPLMTVNCHREDISRKKMTPAITRSFDCSDDGSALGRCKSPDISNSNLKWTDTETSSPASCQQGQRQSFYLIKIENMERDLSPLAVMDFIYQQTSISPPLELSQSPCPECYNGMIYVKTKEHAKRLLNFFLNPANIIVSSSGRPWFVKEYRCEVVQGEIPRPEIQSSDRGHQTSKLRLLNKGSNEHERARKLKELHKEFHEHLESLYHKLHCEETKILQKRSI